MFTLPDAPQSIGGVLDTIVGLYSNTLKRMLVLSGLSALITLPIMTFQQEIIQVLTDTASPVLWSMTTVCVVSVISLSIFGAMVFRMGALTQGGDDPGVAASLGRGLRYGLPLFFGTVLWLLVTIVGLIFLVVPGILFMVSLGLWSICMVLDRDGVIKSLVNSHRLIWGNWWRTTVIAFVCMVLYYVVLLTLTSPFLIMEFAVGPGLQVVDTQTPFTPILYLGYFIANVVVIPLYVAAVIVVHHDLGLRKLGHDIRDRLSELQV